MKKLPEFDVIIGYDKRLNPNLKNSHRLYSTSRLLYTSAYPSASVSELVRPERSENGPESTWWGSCLFFSSLLFLCVTSFSRHTTTWKTISRNEMFRLPVQHMYTYQNPYCVVLRRPRRVSFFLPTFGYCFKGCRRHRRSLRDPTYASRLLNPHRRMTLRIFIVFSFLFFIWITFCSFFTHHYTPSPPRIHRRSYLFVYEHNGDRHRMFITL